MVSDVLLAPDVYVNASVTVGSAPERIVQRALGKNTKGRSKSTEWVLARVRHMLSALPEFKKDAVDQQVALIRSLVDVMELGEQFAPGEWERALVAAAKRAAIKRVVTDHPDLLERETVDGVEFVSTEAFLLELSMAPPPPAR
jgi:23S rRNA U2552 (ribose-2'-O)-methylase RlmE/FtsJ